MTIIRMCDLADFPDGSVRAFPVEGRKPIALIHSGGEFFAIDDTCTHADASLAAGEFDADEGCLECPLHGSGFDVRTGQPRTFPAYEPVAVHRAFVQDAVIFVELSA